MRRIIDPGSAVLTVRKLIWGSNRMPGVGTENLNASVVVMKSAQDGA